MSPRKLHPEPRRGLVLGAGGVLGASWTIGALAALEEETGWDPRTAEVIVGTSAGSIIGAFLACGISVTQLLNHQRGVIEPGDPLVEYDYEVSALPPLPRLRLGSPQLLLNTARHPRRVTPMTAAVSLLPSGRGSLDEIGRLLGSVVEPGDWATHPQTWIVATDYSSGRRVAFGRENAPEADLISAVMASCAIPAWYSPVTIGGRRYIDGGTCSPTSLDLVASLELDEVFVVSPMTSFEFDRPTTAGVRVERYLRRKVSKRLLREAEKVRARGADVVLLGPGAEDLAGMGANLMDPRRRHAVLETSLRTSREALRRHAAGLAAAG